MGLEANDVVHGVFFIVPPELHHSVGILSGAGVRESHRFHGAKAHGVFAARSHDFDGHAAFEDFFIFKAVDRRHFCLAEGFAEGFVFFFIHGAIQVCGFTFVVAGHAVHYVHVQGLFRHDGRCGVVEMESFSAAEGFDVFCQLAFGQGAGGDDDDAILRDFFDFLFHDVDQRVVFHFLGHCLGISHAVHRQSAAGGHAVGVCSVHDEGVKMAHFLFQETYCIGEPGSAKRIAAHQFTEVGSVMRRRLLQGTHFDELYRDSHFRQLPGRFTTRKPRADDGYMFIFWIQFLFLKFLFYSPKQVPARRSDTFRSKAVECP